MNIVYGMPKALVELGGANQVLPDNKIACRVERGPPCANYISYSDLD